MAIFLRGFLLGNDRDKVKKIKGQTGLVEFDRLMGQKHYLSTKYYPIEESLQCQKAAAQVIYGNTNPESFYKLGQWDWKMVAESQAGKVIFILLCPTLEKALQNFSKLMNTFYTGINCETKEVKGDSAKLIIYNDPYPQTYFQGLFFQAVQHFGFKPTVTINNSQPGKRIFHLSWTKN